MPKAKSRSCVTRKEKEKEKGRMLTRRERDEGGEREDGVIVCQQFRH